MQNFFGGETGKCQLLLKRKCQGLHSSGIFDDIDEGRGMSSCPIPEREVWFRFLLFSGILTFVDYLMTTPSL